MTLKTNDIITAVSTPHGRGAISCIRISGEGSAKIVSELTGKEFCCKDEKQIKERHGKMIPCIFRGRIKDKIMAVVYYGDKSFTGEESAELYFHGGIYITEQALLSIINKGARIAEAGEFTRRAFLNGKIDLTQAEGISDLIDGDNLISLEAAFEQSEGAVRKKIEDYYKRLTETAAKAEVCIDYPEEDIEEQTREQLYESVESIEREIEKEIKNYDGGRIKREGFRVALTGETNAGKSTLFNSLIKDERAIVSEEEGTTRDTIEEKILYKDTAIVFTDTAGIRETDSKAEKLGIERSFAAAKEADLVLNVIVLKKGEEIEKESKKANGEKTLNIFNYIGETNFKEEDGVIKLNAKTGDGVQNLLEKIYGKAKEKTDEGSRINNARQYEALKNASENLKRAKNAINTLTLDCVCADLRGALEALGKITGRNASESVIDEIFSRFCVGK